MFTELFPVILNLLLNQISFLELHLILSIQQHCTVVKKTLFILLILGGYIVNAQAYREGSYNNHDLRFNSR